MKKASKKDLPIFVISHWPLNQTHGLPLSFGDEDYDEMTGGMGEKSADIENALIDGVVRKDKHIDVD